MARVLVVGTGGLGGIVAGALTEAEADVTAVTTNPAILEAVRTRGFVLREEGEERAIRGRIEPAPPPGETFDVVILATQPPSVEDAARTALPHLADDGVMVVLQNGLCEQRVAKIAGADRVLGAIVAWGASVAAPGVYERTAAGGFTIGRLAPATGGLGQGERSEPLDGAAPRSRRQAASPGANNVDPDDACRGVGALLEAVGPVSYTSNLAGARWSKLALNCAISSLGTIAGEHLGPLVRVRRYRRLALEIMTEAVSVAKHEGVRLEKVAGTLDLEWVALSDADRAARLGSAALTAKHALLLAVGLRYRRMRSSMLAAIERGRTPAIDFLNGEVVSRARQHGLPAPVNAKVVETVWAIAHGEARSSRDLLDAVCAATRETGAD